ncbi:MAG: quinolinate synthase, partial [Desulfuromonadales bacterium C00003096]
IERLKREKNAVILAHNYERPEVLDVADVTGGTIGLLTAAMETTADIIVVCGVDFMAETAAILNPDNKVIVPVQNVVCPLARQLSKEELLEAKMKNPDAKVLRYMNSNTETKALADCVCTAGNAVKIVETMDGSSPILFGPDHSLAYYVTKRREKEIIGIPDHGMCPVHHKITVKDMIKAKDAHPGAKIIAHPECTPEVQDYADYLGSTGAMINFCKDADATEFLVADEVGLINMLERQVQGKSFYPVSDNAFCRAMKKPTLASIEKALKKDRYEVVVPHEIAADARRSIDRMFELS